MQLVSGFLWDILYFKTELTWNQILGSVLIISILFIVSLMKACGLMTEEESVTAICVLKTDSVDGTIAFGSDNVKVNLKGLEPSCYDCHIER